MEHSGRDAHFVDYIDKGGRAFATHFFYNFFATENQCALPTGLDATCQGQTPLPTVGAWGGNTHQPHAADANCGNIPNPTQLNHFCSNIDTGVPKGKAFADWYKANNGKIAPGWGDESYGYVDLTDIRYDMGPLEAQLVSA